MNIRDLQYIISVAKHKNFIKAANECFVSQPTLSAQIKKLEEELNITLFERNKKQVITTKAGEAIIEQAKTILQGVDGLKSLASHLQNSATQITLGAIPTLGPYLYPLMLPTLKKQCSDIDFKIVEMQTDHLLTALRDGHIDMAFLALPFDNRGLITHHIFKEPFELALCKSNPLAKKHTIKISDLKSQSILLLNEGHCLRDQTIDVCHLDPEQSFQATSLETLIYMTELDEGVTLLPKLAAVRQHKNIQMRPISPKPYREIVCSYRASAPLQTQYQAIIRVVEKTLP